MEVNLISRHVKDKMVIENSHHEFTRGKLCLTNLISLLFVEKERAENSIFPFLRKDFYTGLYKYPYSQIGERWTGWGGT